MNKLLSVWLTTSLWIIIFSSTPDCAPERLLKKNLRSYSSSNQHFALSQTFPRGTCRKPGSPTSGIAMDGISKVIPASLFHKEILHFQIFFLLCIFTSPQNTSSSYLPVHHLNSFYTLFGVFFRLFNTSQLLPCP